MKTFEAFKNEFNKHALTCVLFIKLINFKNWKHNYNLSSNGLSYAASTSFYRDLPNIRQSPLHEPFYLNRIVYQGRLIIIIYIYIYIYLKDV